jgi:predicted GNAT superfamily acetyltransferase
MDYKGRIVFVDRLISATRIRGRGRPRVLQIGSWDLSRIAPLSLDVRLDQIYLASAR